MLHVCYMFEQHVTWLNPFVQGHWIHIMLYGYMFLFFTRFKLPLTLRSKVLTFENPQINLGFCSLNCTFDLAVEGTHVRKSSNKFGILLT